MDQFVCGFLWGMYCLGVPLRDEGIVRTAQWLKQWHLIDEDISILVTTPHA